MKRLALLFAFFSFAASAANLQMAVTVDDLPVAQNLDDAEVVTLHDNLIEVFRKHRVPAIGFVSAMKLEKSDVRLAQLQRWLDAGLELGNHGYAHRDLHEVGVESFVKEIDRGDEFMADLRANDHHLHWFRHPYLHTGRSREDRERVQAFLGSQGYRVAPVTIDNSEWIYALAYEKALAAEDEALRKRIGEDYVRYMLAKTHFFETNAQALFGRDIPQVLLVHANRLNRDWMDALLDRLGKAGYEFVSLESALEDPAYESEDNYFGPAGITWLHRWAITQKRPRSFYEGEPETPGWILAIAELSSE